MVQSKHKSDKNFLKKHICTGSVSGGACLCRHIGGVTHSSCSHRWQAFKKAEDDSGLYDYPAYKSLTWIGLPRNVMTSQWGHFRSRLWLPNPGDWDLHATSSGPNFQRLPNFQSWSRVPYWHQAHHIIPNSVLNGCITEAAKQAKSRSLEFLVRSGLLEAKYNLNHKNNMVILPMGKAVANALGLPRHIVGVEGGRNEEHRSHTAYSAKVEQQVKDVISEYAAKIDKKDHETNLGPLSKAKLERISKTIYKKLKGWGKHAGGAAVDDLPDWYFG